MLQRVVTSKTPIVELHLRLQLLLSQGSMCFVVDISPHIVPAKSIVGVATRRATRILALKVLVEGRIIGRDLGAR